MGIGLSVTERESSDPIAVQPADLGISAWPIASRRGPVDGKAIRFDSFDEFKVRMFAEPDPNYLGYYMVKGLYNNAGDAGATIHATRVKGSGGVALSASLVDSAGTPVAVWTVKAGQRGLDDPGTWANGTLFVQVVAASSGESTKRDLLVFYQSAIDSAPVFKERWKNLDNTSVVGIVNHSGRGSLWVKIALIGTPTTIPAIQANPVAISAISGATAGTDPATPAESAYNTAFSAFNGLSVQLIAGGDLQTLLMATNLQTYALNRGDVMSLFSASQGIDDAGLASTYANLKQLKSYLAGYRGWVRVDNEKGGDLLVPALGHLIGAGYIRKLRAKGGYPHVAPAGALANLNGILEVDDGVYDQTRLGVVNATGFNPVVFQSGSGTFAKTSRTFSTLDKWYSIHVRIQANFFKTSFLNTFTPLEQESNNDDTRRRLRNPITSFMEDQFDHGGLTDTGGFANNCRVKCDDGNNTDAIVQARRMICDVTYRPVEVAESIEINLIRTTEGLKAGES